MHLTLFAPPPVTNVFKIESHLVHRGAPG